MHSILSGLASLPKRCSKAGAAHLSINCRMRVDGACTVFNIDTVRILNVTHDSVIHWSFGPLSCLWRWFSGILLVGHRLREEKVQLFQMGHTRGSGLHTGPWIESMHRLLGLVHLQRQHLKCSFDLHSTPGRFARGPRWRCVRHASRFLVIKCRPRMGLNFVQ